MSDNATAASDIADKIRTANQQFTRAFHEKDAACIASLYARKALLLPPGANITDGADAITSFWQGAMDKGLTDAVLETVSVEAMGAAVLEIGRYTLMAGSAAVDRGKYLVVWQQEDGSWKLYRDIWNTDNVATTA